MSYWISEPGMEGADASLAAQVNNAFVVDQLAARAALLAALEDEIAALELATGVPLIAMRQMFGLPYTYAS